jgi:hypothetical protein
MPLTGVVAGGLGENSSQRCSRSTRDCAELSGRGDGQHGLLRMVNCRRRRLVAAPLNGPCRRQRPADHGFQHQDRNAELLRRVRARLPGGHDLLHQNIFLIYFFDRLAMSRTYNARAKNAFCRRYDAVRQSHKPGIQFINCALGIVHWCAGPRRGIRCVDTLNWRSLQGFC